MQAPLRSFILLEGVTGLPLCLLAKTDSGAHGHCPSQCLMMHLSDMKLIRVDVKKYPAVVEL